MHEYGYLPTCILPVHTCTWLHVGLHVYLATCIHVTAYVYICSHVYPTTCMSAYISSVNNKLGGKHKLVKWGIHVVSHSALVIDKCRICNHLYCIQKSYELITYQLFFLDNTNVFLYMYILIWKHEIRLKILFYERPHETLLCQSGTPWEGAW